VKAHCLLTGGTGFLGSRLAPRLVAAGYRLHVLARTRPSGGPLAELDATWHGGDLRDRAAVGRALARAREECGGGPLDVLHCGAVISYRSADLGLQRAVNVQGTRNVVDAARRRGVRRLLHVSSVVTVGHARGQEVLDESACFNGASLHVDYVDTKRAAEEYALSAGGDLEVVVVNPSAIFGLAGPRSNSAYFLRRAAAGAVRVAPPGTVGVVGVEDVADGTLAALLRGRPGARYLLSESSLPLRELLALVAEECGVQGPRFTVPVSAWTALGVGARLVELAHPLERLTPQSVRMLGAHFRIRADRAREELGWKPRAIREVLGETLDALGLRPNPTDQRLRAASRPS
jgi:dihydroflavonol-4-reductase